MRVDEFDPQRVVEVLNRHQVEYVLVGGYAAQLYGARRPTYDIDITPSTTLENLHRLSAALRETCARRQATSTSPSCRRVSRKAMRV
jgi:hypothetical protein